MVKIYSFAAVLFAIFKTYHLPKMSFSNELIVQIHKYSFAKCTYTYDNSKINGAIKKYIE